LTDAAHLWLAPDRCVTVLQHRGLRSRAVVRRQNFEPGSDGLLAAARSELAALPPRTPARVTLSNHLVRYELVPFSPQIVGHGALAKVAQQAFRHVHGAVAEQWTVSVSATGTRTRVAAAIDTPLRQGLIDAARSAGVFLAALDPLLMDAYNGARGHLFASGWFAVAEPGRATLVRTLDGEWVRVVSVRCADDWRAAIAQLVSREAPWVDANVDGFCQVADLSYEQGDEPPQLKQRVMSVLADSLREAA
jgi:hypothetical protein